MKKIMMLGGNYVQMTATLAAKKAGYYVISVDYLPDNPAHQYADEYYNISTVDKEKVLELAQKLAIDGIVSYASDVSAPTAAYVAEKLGLPTNPYESVFIMTHKDKFRTFLEENGFPVPEGKSFSDYEKALIFFKSMDKPVMVKPIDSSGSKGVSKVFTESEFCDAWKEAMGYSISKNVIVEKFIERKGYQIDGDIFVIDGRIRFWGICDQHHDDICSKYTPIGLSYPSMQKKVYQDKAKKQVESVLSLLNMTMGGYNVEYIVGQDDEVYIIEIGPRNGGNLIPDTIYEATGFDMASYVVRQAVGDDCQDASQLAAKSFCSSYVIHSTEEGIYCGIKKDDYIKDKIVREEILIHPGDMVHRFKNASFGIGYMILRFDSAEELCDEIDHMNDHVQVMVERE